MDNLYDIFLEKIIDAKTVYNRKTTQSNDLKDAEEALVKLLTTNQQKKALLYFKNCLIEHMLLIRDEDCEKVLAVAMTFERLIHGKMEEIKMEECCPSDELDERIDRDIANYFENIILPIDKKTKKKTSDD